MSLLKSLRPLWMACGWSLLAGLGPCSASAQTAAPALQTLIQTLGRVPDPAAQLNILRGINAAMKGQRNVPAPAEWPALYEKLAQSPNAELRQQAQALAVTFGGGMALEELRQALVDTKLPLERRRAALDSLVGARDAKTLPLLLALLPEAGALRAPAVRALASYDDTAVPGALLASYARFSTEEKRDALAALTMRPAWAATLLAAVDSQTLPRTAISVPLARQLQDLHDAAVDRWLAKNWGAVRTSSAEKQQEMARFKDFLTPVSLQKADAAHGRALFAQTCAVCHTIFGTGAKIGPELPGAFDDIDYLLQNILDPNAIIGKDYQQTVVQQKDGQTLIGIVASEDAATLTLKSLAGPVTLQRADIAQRTVLEVSLMPEGLLTGRTEQEVRDLFAYLGRHGQVPMLASEMNISDFFNGTDLAHWQPTTATAWKVEGSEIHGQNRGETAELLTSDLVLPNGRVTCELQLQGPGASVELVALDPEDPGTPLGTYRVEAEAGSSAKWLPLAVEISTRGERREVRVNGGLNLTAHHPTAPGETARGVVLGFRLYGSSAQLHLRKLQATLDGGK